MANPLTAPAGDNRERLLQEALLLFRVHGYHGVGVSDILAAAALPKGSLYHHFPGGKDQIAVEVITRVTDSALALIAKAPARSTAQRVRLAGAQMQKWMLRTGGGTLALLASFAADGDARPVVRAAVQAAYQRLASCLAGYLKADGLPARTAQERAFLVLALLEGGGLTSQACAEPRHFAAAVEHAAALCDMPFTGSRVTKKRIPAQKQETPC